MKNLKININNEKILKMITIYRKISITIDK